MAAVVASSSPGGGRLAGAVGNGHSVATAAAAAKAEKRRKKKKKSKQRAKAAAAAAAAAGDGNGVDDGEDRIATVKKEAMGDDDDDADEEESAAAAAVQIEYVADPDLQAAAEENAELAAILKRFAPPEVLTAEPVAAAGSLAAGTGDEAGGGGGVGGEAGSDEWSGGDAEEGGGGGGGDGGDGVPGRPTKKERKKLKLAKVHVLKQLVSRPELVELHDANSPDPLLLLYLKAYRNTVPVPRHWLQKRKYLQGKRGMEKSPFDLPEFIANTGISKLRQAYMEKEEQKKLKAKQRERMQPKMHKMDIDYQVLHDAFFKFQTKPKLTLLGDLYYEGKEFEVKNKHRRPGELSEDLKRALGMPPGAPPPWLINMQRYGPPPSYPNLKIPGLNAPLPPGAQWGYHPGGWGKPPVNDAGVPLYGDVFGTVAAAHAAAAAAAAAATGQPMPEGVAQPGPDGTMPPVPARPLWGVLAPEVEEEEVSGAENAAVSGEEAPESGGGAEAEESGTITEGGVSSVAGLETPEAMELRKRSGGAGASAAAAAAAAAGAGPTVDERPLYQVLPQTETSVGGAVYGSSHKYVVPAAAAAGTAATRVDLLKSQKTEKIAVTLDPTELEQAGDEGLTDDMLKKKYQQALADRAEPPREDFSDLLAEQEKKKRKKADQKADKEQKKKGGEFKF